ncbi:peptidylprolyl isomerase [Asticcacaulis sp. SL142]|uniref:peptidylprolyl isomerase n=1 Tax=Asticcacaulis sp. SL142 TaxID=2995155 RepID=UPI00226D3BD9|nr:peptidylprolyl isomerase [Asticcacaulis sp. SL142]WAC46829.1 peptidylprolyl isomerase [Asticcacaulis sp. SL142]
MRRHFLLGALGFVGAGLSACFQPPEAPKKPEPKKPAVMPTPPPPPPPPVLPDITTVALETSKGEIVIELYGKKAPITVANFLRYVDSGKFEGANFWRAMKSYKGGFVQATANGHKFPPIAHESTKMTGLTHTDGTISMARYDVGTASNGFTISVGDMTYMDAGKDDPDGFAAFGKVTKGMDVVKKILNGKITKEKFESGWDGQMLAEPVTILSAKRIDGSKPPAPVTTPD